MSLGSLSVTSEYTFVFFPSIGSIDLLNSSSSIMTLVSIFSFSSPIFLFWSCAARSAVCCACCTRTVRSGQDASTPLTRRHNTQRHSIHCSEQMWTNDKKHFRDKSLFSCPYLDKLFIETELKECYQIVIVISSIDYGMS